MDDFSVNGLDGLKVVIVGGGFTGAAVVAHLVRDGLPRNASIVIVEPRSELGRGLAYSADDPSHRINVPAGKMTLFPDLPDDFQHYLEENPPRDADLIGRDGSPYPQRSVFGDYVGARLQPLIAQGRVTHWQTRATSITHVGDRYRIEGTDTKFILADIVVLAVSHPAPSLPKALVPFRDDVKLVADVTVSGAIDVIDRSDRVLIVGNGLSAADVSASLHRRQHSGHITSISRRGLRSRGHGPAGQEPFGDFVTLPATSATALLRRVRNFLREAERHNMTWHSVLDAVRTQGGDIWAHLPVAERRRIVRHLRPFWDVHRFRIAPQIEDTIESAIAAGRMDVKAASLVSVKRAGEVYRVTLWPRRASVPVELEVDAIVVTTGPEHGGILASQGFLSELNAHGILQACPTGLGILVDGNSNPISVSGQCVPGIFIAGPLARGTFGELMGLPQVTEHAILIASQINQAIKRFIPRGGPVYRSLEPANVTS